MLVVLVVRSRGVFEAVPAVDQRAADVVKPVLAVDQRVPTVVERVAALDQRVASGRTSCFHVLASFSIYC